MLPWVYGFSWETGQIVFLTIFYSVVGILIASCGLAAVRALRDLKSKNLDGIRWHVDFNDLGDFARTCRHVFTGDVSDRICPNGFDCRTCRFHREFAATKIAAGEATAGMAPDREMSRGLRMPLDRLYHRGHTWVRKEADGTLTVGLDEFGKRVLRNGASAELPRAGSMLTVNGKGWFLLKDGSRIRVLSPVDGKVVETGGPGSRFYLRVAPPDDRDLRHLLNGEEIRPWITREIERLQMALASEEVGIDLADGGELVEDLTMNYPDADWDGVWREIFLEP